MPEEALTSFTYLMHTPVCGSEIVNEVRSRSRIEYLIPTNNIIVIDLYFNFTDISNLTDRL